MREADVIEGSVIDDMQMPFENYIYSRESPTDNLASHPDKFKTTSLKSPY